MSPISLPLNKKRLRSRWLASSDARPESGSNSSRPARNGKIPRRRHTFRCLQRECPKGRTRAGRRAMLAPDCCFTLP